MPPDLREPAWPPIHPPHKGRGRHQYNHPAPPFPQSALHTQKSAGCPSVFPTSSTTCLHWASPSKAWDEQRLWVHPLLFLESCPHSPACGVTNSAGSPWPERVAWKSASQCYHPGSPWLSRVTWLPYLSVLGLLTQGQLTCPLFHVAQTVADQTFKHTSFCCPKLCSFYCILQLLSNYQAQLCGQ